jgi:nitrogen PTS system EIIA component
LHFGSTLRLLRIDAGMSLRELARRIGVSSAYLSRVENGHDPVPTVDRIAAIADTLGLPRSVLVELARQVGPAVSGYLQRVPEASSLFLEIARRDLRGPQIARLHAFLDAEFPRRERPLASSRLVDFLPTSRILLGISCVDFEDLVSIAAVRLGDEIDPRTVVERVLSREREASTMLGSGFGAPHGSIAGVPTSAALLTLASPLHTPTPDGEPLRVALLLVGERIGLESLTRVARLATPETVDELCHARTPRAARSIVERLESLW